MAAPRREDLRESILEKTTLLLQTSSFDDITLAGIAGAAGISKGTLYYYYNNDRYNLSLPQYYLF